MTASSHPSRSLATPDPKLARSLELTDLDPRQHQFRRSKRTQGIPRETRLGELSSPFLLLHSSSSSFLFVLSLLARRSKIYLPAFWLYFASQGALSLKRRSSRDEKGRRTRVGRISSCFALPSSLSSSTKKKERQERVEEDHTSWSPGLSISSFLFVLRKRC